MITLDFNEIYKLYEAEKKTNYHKLKNEYNKLDVQTKLKVDNIYEIMELMLKNKIQPLFKKIVETNKKKLYEINTNKNIILLDKKKYIIEKNIGEGHFSQVKLVSNNNNKYACKIQYFDKENINTSVWISRGRPSGGLVDKNMPYWNNYNYLEKFMKINCNEFDLSKNIGKHNIGPKAYHLYFAYDSHVNNICSIMIMEYLDGQTLANYKKKVTDEIKNQLSNQIEKLHKLNIIHQDLHQNNIMIVHKNKKIYVYLIDLGGSLIKNNILNYRKNKNYSILDTINNNNNISDLILLSYSLFKNNKINIID